MLYSDATICRIIRYVTIAMLLTAFALSFLSCIRAQFIPFFPERMEDPAGFAKYHPMLPGFPRYLLIVAAALILVGRRWSDILSLAVMVPPVLITVCMKTLYKVFEPMGGLGGYVYSYTAFGTVAAILMVAAVISIFVIVCLFRKRRQTE